MKDGTKGDPAEGNVQERIRSIWEGDRVARLFDMRLVEAGAGYAVVAASVKEPYLNAHHIAHGALFFAVADLAFALSVNAEADAVGVQWSFNVFRSAAAGEEVVAESRVIHRGRQSVVAELSVRSGEGKLLVKGQATALPLPRRRDG